MSNLYPGYDPRTAVARNKDCLYQCFRTLTESTNKVTQAHAHSQIHKHYANIIEALQKASEHEGQPVSCALSSLKVWTEEYDRYVANPQKFVEEFF
jgi:hypothetical protein